MKKKGKEEVKKTKKGWERKGDGVFKNKLRLWWSQMNHVRILALLLSDCVSSDKTLNLS